jgi:hypothetical protein
MTRPRRALTTALGALLATATATACGLSLVGTAPSDGGEDGGDMTDGAREASSAEAGAEDAGGDALVDATCDADFASDPSHCGACGIDCLGGGCEAGRCGAVKVVTGQRPRDVRVVGTDLFWVDELSGQVSRTSLVDAGTQALATNAGSLWTIEVTGTHVYWGRYNPNELWRRPLDLSAAAERLSTGVLGAMSRANDGTIFFADYYGSRVLRLNPATSAWSDVFLPSVPQPWGVHARAGELLVPITGDADGTRHGPIRRYALADAGLRDAAVDDASSPQCVVSDETYLYFTSWYGKQVWRARLDRTQPPDVLHAGLTEPAGIALGGGVVYFTSGNGVYRAALPP